MVRICSFTLVAAWFTAGFSVLYSCEAQIHDNTSNSCSNLGKNKFECKSGDCIHHNLLCNNEKDCIDGSDESDEICKKRSVRQAGGGCMLPQQPSNGRYSLGGCDPPACQPTAGSRVDTAILTYTCAAGYTLNGTSLIFCDQKWMSQFPTCVARNRVRQCSPLKSSTHLIRCLSGAKVVRCDQPMQPSTKAFVMCNEYYEEIQSDTDRHEITCNGNGYWSQTLLQCVPKCGKLNFTGSAIDTDSVKSSYLPWFAAVMKKDERGLWQYVCSANIIAPRVVVSVAHCLWNEQESKPFNADDFEIVVGKYELGPRETPSKYTQQISVDKIQIPPGFQGRKTLYQDDISVLILKNDITMNEVVQPVCVDFNNSFSPYFVPGKLGIGSSIGEPVNGMYKVGIVTMPLVDFSECVKNVPPGFQQFLTKDKFCAGNIKSKGVCAGDSGSGFTNQFRDGKWYLTGILSVGVRPTGDKFCDTDFYEAYTRVSLFLKFIRTHLDDLSNNINISGQATPPLSPSCKENEFQCTSSECIIETYLCDGLKHCADGSDETYGVCHSFTCPQTTFQCRYGACVDTKFRCNGIKECEDNSDEESCLTPTVNPTNCFYPPSNGCKLPKQPENGLYTYFGYNTNDQPLPDSIVPVGVLLNFSCNPGFVLNGPHLIACYDNWTTQPPSCHPVLCDPLKNPSREIQCIFRRDDVDCMTKSVNPGTRATVKCKVNYETIPGLQTYDMICESNGRWNRELHSCVPKCGIPNVLGVPFVGSGYTALLAEFPWHVGFYKALENGTVIPSCGGSIVSPRVVISAAHCFWKNNTVDFADYKVVAGKYFYAWESKTKYVQHLQIETVFLPRKYKGPGRNYADDIAIIVLKYQIYINEAVRPVCVDYDQTFLRYFSPVGTVGNVTGWGLNEKQSFNEVLHVANMPYVDIYECERNTPDHFHALLTSDKFCAGNINKTTACPGDSGGGYTVRFRDGRSYLVGIVSAGPSDLCALFPYVAFTNVYNHLDFIREYVYKYL